MIDKTYMDIAMEDYDTAFDLRNLGRLNPCVKFAQQFVERTDDILEWLKRFKALIVLQQQQQLQKERNT